MDLSNILVLDIENSVQFVDEEDEETGKITKFIDNSPFNPKNKLVAAGWISVKNKNIGEYNHVIFNHNDILIQDARKIIEYRNQLQQAIDNHSTIAGHNIKYDLMWLSETGFNIDGKQFYDTMTGEYILARGVQIPLSLKETAIRRNVTHKKSELVDEYFNSGVGFEAIPLPIMEEYLEADLQSTAEIVVAQLNDWEAEENKSLFNIVILMSEMLDFILEIERNGIMIDTDKLKEIEQEYRAELIQLENRLEEIAREVLGDTPFSLTSGVDISKIVYSREVVDRDKHKEIFNLGVGLDGKKKYPPYMTASQFAKAVKSTTKVARKTTASHCSACYGKGHIRKIKKDGTEYKKDTKCKKCEGRGFLLTETNEIAGLKLIPERPSDASVHGFSVSKLEFDRLIAQATDSGKYLAVEFLEKKKRLNAVNTYLNSFVTGIQRWVRDDGLLHAWFNQTVARTGRLSSSKPNFQNQPKEKKFPIRSCVKSRFTNGVITECDFSGLEFVVAGELSRDPQIIEDILNKKDIHKQTASIVYKKDKDNVTKDERNESKKFSFAPLFGAQGNDQPEYIKNYFKQFFVIYKRHGEWQQEQMNAVLREGFIRTPSGREYMFPGTRRLKSGRVTNATNIVNYPVQGFATGDIVPLACIRALRKFRELKLQSKLILTVHDSIVADTHPSEKQIVVEVLNWATTGVVEEIKERWKYEMVMPLRSETNQGINWMNMEVVE